MHHHFPLNPCCLPFKILFLKYSPICFPIYLSSSLPTTLASDSDLKFSLFSPYPPLYMGTIFAVFHFLGEVNFPEKHLKWSVSGCV